MTEDNAERDALLTIRSSLDSLMYAAPEMEQFWLSRIRQAVAEGLGEE